MFIRLFKEGFIFAVNSIIVNKLRTFLSLFGITIGIFSIISVFTVLDWMAKSIHESISTLGDNVIYVEKWPWSFNPNLAWWDIINGHQYQKMITKLCLTGPSKASTACYSVMQPKQIKYNKNLANDITIWATTPEFQEIRSSEIANGRFFSPEESASGKNVAIIGAVHCRKAV